MMKVKVGQKVYQFQVVPDLNEEEINLSFLDPLNGLATIHGYCFSTNDGGITWEQILNLSGMYQSFTHIEYLTLGLDISFLLVQ